MNQQIKLQKSSTGISSSHGNISVSYSYSNQKYKVLNPLTGQWVELWPSEMESAFLLFENIQEERNRFGSPLQDSLVAAGVTVVDRPPNTNDRYIVGYSDSFLSAEDERRWEEGQKKYVEKSDDLSC